MSWQIDLAHSEVNFTVRHMMISKARGQFQKFSGTVEFDPANFAAATAVIEIDVNSINTREAMRDNHLRSADFFDIANYPTMTFRSTGVKVLGDAEGQLIGDLTIRGVTKEVTLDVAYAGQAKSPWGTTSSGFSASTKINRKDWGLVWNQALETGGVLVGDEVRLDIELELVQQ